MRIKALAAISILVIAIGKAQAPDPTVIADIDEAFRLAGVRTMLESLPAHVNEMTTAAVGQLAKEKRQQYEPLIKDVSIRFLEPGTFYSQLRTYFVKHYDAAHMATFLALERTPVYRTMHRMEEAANTPAAQPARRRFESSLKSDPPSTARIAVLQRLDEARNATGLQVRIVIGIMKAISAGLAAQTPVDLETENKAFADKVRPVLASNVLQMYLFIYRNADDQDLEDYISAARQKDILWFNQHLQSAILAVAEQRSARAGEDMKTRKPPTFN